MTQPSVVKFEKYSAEQRRDMAKKGFALSDGSFPIGDREDLGNALHRIGTTNHPRSQVVAHIRKRARALGALDMLGEKTAPHARSNATSQACRNDAVRFSERKLTPEGKVIRRGKIYEAGPRIDMHGIPFGLSEEELAKIVLDFEPLTADGRPSIPIGSGHPEAPSPFDGHLGHVTNLFIGEKPTDLWAEAELPPFVDEVLGEEASNATVSALFDRWTKNPIGLDFVTEPNVTDAMLTAAFAKFAGHDTPGGKAAMQNIHDATSRHGAVCQTSAGFASRRENGRVQMIHDITRDGGAECKGMPTDMGTPMMAATPPAKKAGKGMDWKGFWGGLFAASKEEGLEVPQEASFAATAEATVEDPAAEPAQSVATPSFDTTSTGTTAAMQSVMQQAVSGNETITIPNSLTSGTVPNGNISGTATTILTPYAQSAVQKPEEEDNSMVTQNVSDQEVAALRARALQLESDLRREQAHRIESEAVSFADKEISEHRSLPSEYEDLIEMFRQASADDAVIGTIKMADGVETSRTEKLKAQMGRRPEHWMTKEQMATHLHPDVVAAAMATAQAGEHHKPMDIEEKKRLLGMTDQGQATLARKYGVQS